jgi:hypothetical protein
MKVAYRVKGFRKTSLILIEIMNAILDDETQGYAECMAVNLLEDRPSTAGTRKRRFNGSGSGGAFCGS